MEEVEVKIGMVCVWAMVVGGVGTDGGLVCEGFADVGGGGGLVCALVGTVWVFVCGGAVWVCVWAGGWACVWACEGGGD